jgi:hypothetical protein
MDGLWGILDVCIIEIEFLFEGRSRSANPSCVRAYYFTWYTKCWFPWSLTRLFHGLKPLVPALSGNYDYAKILTGRSCFRALLIRRDWLC